MIFFFRSSIGKGASFKKKFISFHRIETIFEFFNYFFERLSSIIHCIPGNIYHGIILLNFWNDAIFVDGVYNLSMGDIDESSAESRVSIMGLKPIDQLLSNITDEVEVWRA